MSERNDDGSVLLLALGYAVLALAVVLVCVCGTDLYIAQKRLDALADSAALAGADGFSLVVADSRIRAQLTDAGVAAQASAIVTAMAPSTTVVEAGTPDGVSARVRLTAPWHPPLLSPFVPDGILLESVATSRTAVG